MGRALIRKIEKEKKEQSGTLNLNRLGLSYIPNEIEDFYWLRELEICDNQIYRLENLPDNLEKLIIWSNEITYLENLPDNLKELDISENQIQQLENLPDNLEKLNINENQIQQLENLPDNLEKLNISDNQIQYLENLPDNLEKLDISNNYIYKLENLPLNLKELDISDNQIEVLQNLPLNIMKVELSMNLIDSIANYWNTLSTRALNLKWKETSNQIVYWNDGINLFGNPIQIPPQEIIENGDHAIVDYMEQYFEEHGRRDYLFESKLLIIGESGAGKTTFSRKLKNPEANLPNRDETTHGINIDKWDFEIKAGTFEKLNHGDSTFYVNLWDFGGQAVYHGTHQFFFSDKSLYVLLADTREEKADFSYWLNTIEQLTGEDSNLFILLNRRDERIWQIDENGLKSRFGTILKETKTVDLSVPHEIPNLQYRIKHWLKELPEIGVPLIESWVRIREDLAKETVNSISFSDFIKICKRRKVDKPEFIKNISRYFDRIGVFTHFIDDPILEDKVYLNSNWLTASVYEILDNKLAQEKKGRLNLNEVQSICTRKELDFEVNKLLALLNKFGLMYKTEDNLFIIPRHLPDQKPYLNWNHENEANIVHYRYTFDKYMPRGLMSQLIVALHDYIPDHNKVWKRGVNISFKGVYAEIIEQYGGVNQFDIRIVGTFHRDLLVIITEAFDNILKPFKKLEHEKQIKCICETCLKSDKPYFHNTSEVETALIKKIQKGNPTVECKRSFEDIPIKDLLVFIDFEKVVAKIQKVDSHITPKDLMAAIKALGLKVEHGFETTHQKIDELPFLINKEFKADLEYILYNIDQIHQQDPNQKLLGEIESLIAKELEQIPGSEKVAQEYQEIQEQSEEYDYKKKLVLTLPIIPGILSYKRELSTSYNPEEDEAYQEAKKDLGKKWNLLRSLTF